MPDVLQWWEARFERITLEDRNLPEIAARRMLRPRSEAARRELDRAYSETEKVRQDVFETLLTPHADRAMFRKVYPFSPALVETLVAVSALLQRERTALKVMLQLLVNRRGTLELGEIVPVGDLFDTITEGDEPFTEGMRHHFENARRLYRQKLLPFIERRYGVSQGRGPDTAGRGQRRAQPARRGSSRQDVAAVGARARGRGIEEPERGAACRAQPRVDPSADRGTRGPRGAAALPRLGRGDRRGQDW